MATKHVQSRGKHNRVHKRHRSIRWPYILIILALCLSLLWVVAVFSPNPMVKALRDTYIETAMSTFHHKWLATYFIPHDIIEDTMARAKQAQEAGVLDESVGLPDASQPGHNAQTGDAEAVTPEGTPSAEQPLDPAVVRLLARFDELDPATIPADFAKNYDVENLQISDILSLGIRTTAGDEVWAIDAVNGLLILTVRGSFMDGEFYEGKLALIKDSAQVFMAKNRLEDRGETLVEYCRHNNGILAVNANGFADAEGKGRGAEPIGLMISRGVQGGKRIGSPYVLGGFDYDNVFRAGTKLNPDELRDCAEFQPIIVSGGVRLFERGTGGFGYQPRTVVGQSTEKETLLLIVDGRQPGYSVGATPYDCAEILLRYGCWTALFMDGGSSSSMVYDGEIITKSSSPQAGGRYLPCAWVVERIG